MKLLPPLCLSANTTSHSLISRASFCAHYPKATNRFSGVHVALVTEHYQSLKCLFPITHNEGIANTVQFFPHKVNFPSLTLNDQLLNALEKITTILHSKAFKRHNDVLQVDMSTRQAIEFLTTLLKCYVSVPNATPAVFWPRPTLKLHSLLSSPVQQVPRVETPVVLSTSYPSGQANPTALPRVAALNPSPPSKRSTAAILCPFVSSTASQCSKAPLMEY